MKRLKILIRLFWSYHQRLSELKKIENFSINQERLIYHCPLNASKRRNLARQYINQPMLKYVELARPHILHVGVTTTCNLHCPACPTGKGSLGRPGEHLDFDLYCRTVNALRDYLLFMLFWDWGEPMLHPKIADMIAYAGKSHIKTVISTNGNVANSPKKIEDLVSAGPNVIIVCVDGADQQTYQTYRVGGHLKTVLQTIQRLAEAKIKLKQSYPLIEFRSLATKHTEHQMPELLNLAQKSGADLFTVKTLRPYDYRGYSLDELLVPESANLSRYHYKENKRDPEHRMDFLSKGPLHCGKPFYAPTLNADGTLAFCSYAQNESEFFGSLKEHTFDTIWKCAGSRFRRLNFQQAGGTRSCRTCFFRSDHHPTIIHQVPLRPIPDGINVEAPQSPESFLEAVSRKSSQKEPIG